MRDVPWVWLGSGATVIGLVLLGVAWATAGKSRFGAPLVGTFVLALGVLGLVTGMLLADGKTDEPDALRTGGLAAASVVALYGLWLNDRRRKVEEDRRELEGERAQHDRERVADERFAKAVELLGHPADQVRVGALHALASLAASRPDYTQTVLDVLCSYLRRPFRPVRGAGRNATDNQLEQQVRQTAQRLIAGLLPESSDTGGPRYDLDLTGATLSYLDLSGRRIGALLLRDGYLLNSNNFSRAEFFGPAYFTEAELAADGRLRFEHAVFHDRAWFSLVTAQKQVSLAGTRFAGPSKFANARFRGPVSFEGCEFTEPPDLARATFDGDVTWPAP